MSPWTFRACVAALFYATSLTAVVYGELAVCVFFFIAGSLFTLTLYPPWVFWMGCKLEAFADWWDGVDPLREPEFHQTVCASCSGRMMYYDSQIPFACPRCGHPYAAKESAHGESPAAVESDS